MVKKMSLLLVSMVALWLSTGCVNNPRKFFSRQSFDLKAISIDDSTYPAVVLGGGSAGLTAAIYLSQAGYQPLVIQGDVPGGLITQSHSVRNWPGVLDIPGPQLYEMLYKHAQSTGATITPEKAIAVDFTRWPYTITVQDCQDARKIRTIKALGCIITMGTSSNYLKIPGEQQYWGHGVTNCAVCDGGLFKKKVVAVVGGGDAAIVEASYLSKLASKVYILVRKDKLRAVDRRKDEVLARPNVEIMYNTQVQEVRGTANAVTHLMVKNNKQGTVSELPVDGLFLAIGSTPNSSLFDGQLARDAHGYLELTTYQQTSRPGIFAAGDICDPKFKQAITAAGHASQAALQLNEFLESIGADPSLFVRKVSNEVPKEQSVQAAAQQPVQSSVAPAVATPEERIIEVESAEHFAQLLARAEPKVIDFFATWCGPCKRMIPVVEATSEQFKNVLFIKVDIDHLPDLAQHYHVQGVPTFMFIDAQGRERHRMVGAADSITFESEVKNIS